MTAFTATGVLTRLALRRDRVRLPIWLLGLATLLAATASGIAGLYETEAARVENAAIRATSVAARAFVGPATGTGVGSLTMSEMLAFGCMLAALLNILTVVRHTRQNEELGRAELTGSTAVGRHAGLTAALLVATVANAGLFVLCTLGLAVNGLPLAGSVAAGAAIAGTGLAFAGITAVAAQVAEGARGAIGLATAGLGLAYLLRAIGDATGEVGPSGVTVTAAWPSWLSPIGWSQQLLPFGGNRWWPLVLLAGFAALTVAVAAVLCVHRDVGTGMMPVRRGTPRAGRGLLSPLGLAWRLQRGVLLGWVIGMALLGAAFGAVGKQAGDIFGSESSAQLVRQLGGAENLVDAYFAAMMGLLGVTVAGYTVQALLRVRAEEVGGQAEALLATAVSRPRWLAAHAACAVGGTAVVLAALGASTGLAYGLAAGDLGGALTDLLETTLAQLAPTLVLAGFVLAAFGLLPGQAAALAWAAFAVCLVVGQFGTLLGLPRVVIDVSPFSHLPDLPAEPLTATPLLVMLGVAAVLGALGFASFRRRSLDV